MRFNKYVVNRLDEKVSQKEIDEALMDPNITLGVEFEFLVDEMKEFNDSELTDNYDNAVSDWEDFNQDYREYHREYEKLKDDIYSLNSKKEDLEDKIYELDSNISDLDDEKDARKINDLEKRKTQYENRVSEIETEIDEKETELDELEHPYPGSYYMNYVDYLYKEYSYFRSNPRYWVDEDDFEEPPHPQNISEYTLDDEDKWMGAAKSLRHLFDTLPIPKNYTIEGYGHSDGKTWSIKYDSSIAEEGGVELVSPIINIFDFMKLTPEIFKWIDRHGSTSSSCGFHVHMGLKGVSNLKDVLDPIKLVVMTDEDYIWKFFDERKHNTYTQSMKGPLYNRKVSTDDIKELINWENLKNHIGDDHYAAINFENWEEGHIEFRHMGGEGYHRKFKEILTIVGREAHSLAVGADPDYKRKEYITKLSRLANKLEYIQLLVVREVFDDFLAQNKGAIADESVIKKIKTEMTKMDKKASNIKQKNVGSMYSALYDRGNLYGLIVLAIDELIRLLGDSYGELLRGYSNNYSNNYSIGRRINDVLKHKL